MQTNWRTNGYSRILMKILIFVVVVFAMDFIIGAGLKKLYFTPREGKFHDMTFAFDSTKADIIIVGSSRAAHHYVSQYFEDSLGQTCYNVGNEGAQMLHQQALIASIFKRYNPKMIIWDYWRSLRSVPQTYLELSTILPYYASHPEIRPTVNLRNSFEKYKMISKIYPYNSTLVYNFNKMLGVYKNAEKDESVKGYIPLRSIWKEDIRTTDSVVSPLDSNCINCYKSVIKYCKTNNIRLFIVISPNYQVYKGMANYDKLAQKIAADENIPFFNFSSDSVILSDKHNFSSPIHLNDFGAKLFSMRLIDAIKNYKSTPVLGSLNTK